MFFEDLFGGMPGGMHGHGRGNREPADTQEMYDILGLEKNCNDAQIKRAWRKAAKKYHPDKGGDPEEFKKCQQAHEILADPNKRALYDEGGLEAVSQGHSMSASPFGDIFGRHGGHRETKPRKPPAIKEVIVIDLEDVFSGGSKTINIAHKLADDQDRCTRCNGQGSIMETVRRGPMILQSQRDCPRCGGRGISYTNERTVKKKLEVIIPQGTKHGDTLKKYDEGHQLPGMPHGDVVVTFKVRPHKVFKRLQADLAMAKEITLVEALCGAQFKMKSISRGDWLSVSLKPGQIQPNDVLCIKGQGLPQKGNRSTRGDLYIRFTVVLPKEGTLNDKSLKQLRKLLSPKDVKYDMPNETMNDTRQIETGMGVRLIGLTNRPDLNGVAGKVIEANIKPGNHAVQLVTGQTVSVREELLEITDHMEEEIMADSPKPNDYVENVTGEVVDLDKVQHTPSQYGNAHDDDSEDEREGVSCRQM